MIHTCKTKGLSGREAHGTCCAESAASNPGMKFLGFWMVLMLFLIGSQFASPLHAAIPDAQKTAIAAGVAAGTDIAVIMQNAVAAGLTPEEAVQELVRAGADPGRVVYEAITAKYSAEIVTKAAAEAVAATSGEDSALLSNQTAAIYSAALQAGATAGDVNGWLAAANIPPTVIANAGTQSGQTQGPAEGYSAPGQGPALTSLIGGVGGAGGGVGGAGGGIGGAGVGSPTKPASPTKP
jgi:hypothetical protein